MIFDRESRFSKKFGRDNPWGGHRRRTLSLRQLLLVTGVIVGAAVLCLAMLLVANSIKIKSVEVKGNQMYSADWILQATGIEAEGDYFGFDPATVEDKLRSQLPLLRDVKVRRKLNGTVAVTVTEETGFYYTWHHQNCYLLSDETLRVLTVSSGSSEYTKIGAVYLGLPADARLRVGEILSFEYRTYLENESDTVAEQEGETKTAEKQYAYVWEALEVYRSSELAGITVGLDLSDPYDVYAVLNGQIKVSFGDSDDLEEKIKATVQVLVAEGRYGEGVTDPLPAVIDAKNAAKVGFREGIDTEWPSWAVN